jgi:hypothetical protein
MLEGIHMMMKAIAAIAIFGLLAYGRSEAQKPTPEGGRKTGMVLDTTQTETNAPQTESTGWLFRTQAHIDSVAKMTPEQFKRDLDAHRKLVTEMLDRVGSDVRQLHSKKAQSWLAMSDAMRKELAELPTLKKKALASRMQDHVEHVKLLVGLGKRLMLGTK